MGRVWSEEMDEEGEYDDGVKGVSVPSCARYAMMSVAKLVVDLRNYVLLLLNVVYDVELTQPRILPMPMRVCDAPFDGERSDYSPRPQRRAVSIVTPPNTDSDRRPRNARATERRAARALDHLAYSIEKCETLLEIWRQREPPQRILGTLCDVIGHAVAEPPIMRYLIHQAHALCTNESDCKLVSDCTECAVIISAMTGNLQLLKTLVTLGVNVACRESGTNLSAVQLAFQWNHVECAQYLRRIIPRSNQ